jgi:hypothetical protein
MVEVLAEQGLFLALQVHKFNMLAEVVAELIQVQYLIHQGLVLLAGVMVFIGVGHMFYQFLVKQIRVVAVVVAESVFIVVALVVQV